MGRMKQLATDLAEYADEIEDVMSRIEATYPHPHTLMFMDDELSDGAKKWFIGKFTDDEELVTLIMTKLEMEKNA